MRIICLRCSARYRGRIDAELGLGDRTLLRMDDGSVALHASTGLRPRNYMPAGSSWNERPGLIVVEHGGRGELLEIYVESIQLDHEYHCELDGPLVKLGSERAFSDLLAQRLELIGPRLRLVGRELRTSAGPIDLVVVDERRPLTPIAVEVKRGRASREVPYQLLRYLDALRADPAWRGRPRGVIVAASIDHDMDELTASLGIRFVRLRYQDIAPPELLPADSWMKLEQKPN